MDSTSGDGKSKYRIPKSIPFELRQHCAIYFEEKLYSQALDLLLNILNCGTAASAPAYVPAPQYLALAATIIVHPSTTTRAKSKEEQEAPNLALQLLRLALQLSGPVSTGFNVAFAFRHFDSLRHGGRRLGGESSTTTSSPDHHNATPLNLGLANSGSIWSRAEDFWHVVGWAFNCSVLHPKRWEQWQLWLEFMCLAIQADWEEREKMDNTEGKNVMMDSLLIKYVTLTSGGLGQNRRLLRAIFANGSGASLSQFPQVFKHELKELPNENDQVNNKKRAEVNIDEDKYGDYYLSPDEDNSESQEGTTKSRSKRLRRDIKPTNPPAEDKELNTAIHEIYSNGGVDTFGGFRSLALRQRLSGLLMKAATAMPKAFISIDDLCHLFVEQIRHLPLPVFQAFVAPTALPWLSADAHSTICELLLWNIRESAGPQSNERFLTQEKVERCYLPYAAKNTTTVDNARMSILLESLIIFLDKHGVLRNTLSLREAVSMGNKNRIEKAEAKIRRNKNSRKLEDMERSWLLESADRLLYLVKDILPVEEDD